MNEEKEQDQNQEEEKIEKLKQEVYLIQSELWQIDQISLEYRKKYEELLNNRNLKAKEINLLVENLEKKKERIH